MQEGDVVIADNPARRSRKFVRSYGIVKEIRKSGGVIIEMADGSLIKRQLSSIAVYIQPPSNWQELLKQQEIEFSQKKTHMMPRAKQRNN